MEVTFIWKTGTPKNNGKYLITTKYGEVMYDFWANKDWERHCMCDVMAWCEFVDIQPYKF